MIIANLQIMEDVETHDHLHAGADKALYGFISILKIFFFFRLSFIFILVLINFFNLMLSRIIAKTKRAIEMV